MAGALTTAGGTAAPGFISRPWRDSWRIRKLAWSPQHCGAVAPSLATPVGSQGNTAPSLVSLHGAVCLLISKARWEWTRGGHGANALSSQWFRLCQGSTFSRPFPGLSSASRLFCSFLARKPWALLIRGQSVVSPQSSGD